MARNWRFWRGAALALMWGLLLPAVAGCRNGTSDNAAAMARLDDGSTGDDWAGYGRTSGQQHHSPLKDVNAGNVARLGLAWSLDLPPGNTATEPLAVDGVLYMATGLSVVRAVDAASGRELWTYDPQVGAVGGLNQRLGWGVRGLAWWRGRLFVGTRDGRLIALSAADGRPLWSRRTYHPRQPAYISGAPRVFGGRVLIGSGSTTGAMRGYVAAYDAMSGKPLWRFYTVPGDPSLGFENRAMRDAAKTWAGEWWRFGGGMVWNSMAWDPELDLIYIGVGSPYPWNHRIRSKGRGDNLFVSAIVALDGRTGAYRWHYQTTPGDTWDFDATMDIALADLTIGGKRRKVLMQAPKNGFFYVLDRVTGELLSAEPFARVTWASHVDLNTGRPVEAPGARYDRTGKPVVLSPTMLAAHNWLPMAYSPESGLAYIPAVDWEVRFADVPGFTPPTDRASDGGIAVFGGALAGMPPPTGRLVAFSPVTGRKVWDVAHPTYINGGVLATAGGLVFQGTIDGRFTAYDAGTGKVLWRFDAGGPIMAPPISYRAGGRQYVTVLSGLGMAFPMNAGALTGPAIEAWRIDPLTQPRRVLTFALDGKAALPPAPSAPAAPPPDPGFVPDMAQAAAGGTAFSRYCGTCHGELAVGIGSAPDLRRSGTILDPGIFSAVVRGGSLEARGMPKFSEFPPDRVEAIRHFLRLRAGQLRGSVASAAPAPQTLQIR